MNIFIPNWRNRIKIGVVSGGVGNQSTDYDNQGNPIDPNAMNGLIWDGPDPTIVDSDILFNGTPGNRTTTLQLPTLVRSASIDTQNNNGLLMISAPRLTNIIGNLYINGCPNLTVIEFPSLVVVEGEIGTVADAMVTLSFPKLTHVNGIQADGFNTSVCPNLVTLSLPVFAVEQGYFDCHNCPNLATITIPLLNQVANFFDCHNCPALVSLSIPSLTTVGASALDGNGFFAQNCTALTTVSFPLIILTDSYPVDFSGCALTAASVNHILARCSASNLTSSDINLSGGTNAAPTGQGLFDKGVLIASGCTVTTN